jgi:hypothetical protein
MLVSVVAVYMKEIIVHKGRTHNPAGKNRSGKIVGISQSASIL